MTKQQRTIIRYSISFKQKVAREKEEGLAISEAASSPRAQKFTWNADCFPNFAGVHLNVP